MIEREQGVSQQFFYMTLCTKHNKYQYVEIKQFYKEFKTSNQIKFELIFLLKFLVYQLDLHHLQGNCVVYIFVNTMKSLFYLSIIRIHFILITSDVHKDLSSLWMKYRNQRYKLWTGLFIS
mgnify:CR=1 FL=1